MASVRLPGKPLADIGGLPMIVHVMRRAQEADVGPVMVATDSPEIADAVTAAGGRAVMTRSDHTTGSDRIFEALGKADPDRRARIVVNVQGDFPMLQGADIRAALAPPRRSGGRHRDARAGNHRSGRARRPERRQGDLRGGIAGPPPRALLHPRDRALRRRPALSPHRPLRVSPRRARAVRRAAALAARTARAARTVARARSRHAHRRGADEERDLRRRYRRASGEGPRASCPARLTVAARERNRHP